MDYGTLENLWEILIIKFHFPELFAAQYTLNMHMHTQT